jgi:hypothetical protein
VTLSPERAGRRQELRAAQARLRQEARRVRFHARLAAAPTPARRVAAASDYLRAALAELPPARRGALADAAVTALVTAVENALAAEWESR